MRTCAGFLVLLAAVVHVDGDAPAALLLALLAIVVGLLHIADTIAGRPC